ncbi:glycosyltransferase family 9 protein [Paraburkholderia unamae]|uniref:glycosyltransferase family 9 protein n=1 Tax=Paraburkholderia unamae TaxID=219649 RepID=UPI0021AC2C43|nr:glycosyltransferase family 9 protein [Paraburkholderia unamae]
MSIPSTWSGSQPMFQTDCAAPARRDNTATGRADVPAQPRSAAFVLSPALGDSLNLLVVAHNLVRAGWQVEIFGNHAWSLARWFPHLSIHPALGEEDARQRLAKFGVVVQMHRDRPLKHLRAWHRGFIDLHDIEYETGDRCMAHRFAAFAAAHFALPSVEISNGIHAPQALQYRRHAQRVALHPEASTPDKRWLARRFIGLSRSLRGEGFAPEFVVAESERPHWLPLAGEMPPLHSFRTTSDLAAWLYESGWFIGNDSGVGHLASALGIPTLTVFRRRRVAQRWRPGFQRGEIVLPPWWLASAGLKEKWWRESISTKRVQRAFRVLRARFAPQTE